jgi:hypothetical protein
LGEEEDEEKKGRERRTEEKKRSCLRPFLPYVRIEKKWMEKCFPSALAAAGLLGKMANGRKTNDNK